jgi:hypothetical protein
MESSGGARLQLSDGPPDPKPYEPSLDITAIEHQIGTPAGFKLGVRTEPSDEQVRSAPDVEFGDH